MDSDVMNALAEGPEGLEACRVRAAHVFPGRSSLSLHRPSDGKASESVRSESNPTLYEALGKDEAEEAVVKMVEDMLHNVTQDDNLKSFFVGVDVGNIKRHFIAFVRYAFGGPNNYTGLDLNRAHRRLREEKNLGEEHFMLMIQHMKASLRAVVPKETPEAAIERTLEMRDFYESWIKV